MEELISKKQLLEETQISYGQLYRWKRKHIIPEEWFIKKSAPTGQETFFPREKILERIKVILEKKDGASLDDLAEIFSDDAEKIIPNMEKMIQEKLITEESIILFSQIIKKDNIESMSDFVGVKLFQDYLFTSILTMEECKLLCQFMMTNYEQFNSENARIFLLRSMGTPLVLGVKDEKNIIFDNQYKIVLSYSLYDVIQTIKYQAMK
ncbi:MAG: DUF4004 family protein [Cellulosilyticaceae bacterium]